MFPLRIRGFESKYPKQISDIRRAFLFFFFFFVFRISDNF